MPVYEWESPCGEQLSTVRSMHDDTIHKTCPCCGLEARRVFRPVAIHRFQEHKSIATGQMVGSHKQFKDQLKQASEEATERTGVLHDYQPVDLGEPQALGVTGEGLDETRRARRKLGLDERKTSYF